MSVYDYRFHRENLSPAHCIIRAFLQYDVGLYRNHKHVVMHTPATCLSHMPDFTTFKYTHSKNVSHSPHHQNLVFIYGIIHLKGCIAINTGSYTPQIEWVHVEKTLGHPVSVVSGLAAIWEQLYTNAPDQVLLAIQEPRSRHPSQKKI